MNDLFLLALLGLSSDVFLDGHSHGGGRLGGSAEAKVKAGIDNGLAGGIAEAADGDLFLLKLGEVFLQ